MARIMSLLSMKKSFFKFDNVNDYHFLLMNIVMLITEKYNEGDYYCYCNRYLNHCCFPLIKCFLRKRRPLLRSMCKLQSFCVKKRH